jgi:hypothetical protein
MAGPLSGKCGPMTDAARLVMSFDRIAKRLKERGRSRHAGGYGWLIENYDAMSQVVAAVRPSWNAIAEEAANAGVRGVRNQVISGDSLRRTWKRVCRDVQRAAAASEPAGAVRARPSRTLPADWTPPLADPPPARSRPMAPPSHPPVDYRPEDDETLSEEVRETFRNLTADLRYRDRHLRHPTSEDWNHE